MNDLFNAQVIFAKNVSLLISFIFSKNYSCTFGEAFRTTEQADWDAQKGIGIVDSLHCKRLAIDLNIFDASHNLLRSVDDYKPFGLYWESLNPINRWGGSFHDRVDSDHFEMNFKEPLLSQQAVCRGS